MAKKLISIVTGCCNEVENLPELYDRIKTVMAKFPAYDWELLVADNRSTDGTRELLRRATEEAAGRQPLWTVRIWVGDTEVVYRDFRAPDAQEAVRLAAEEAMSRDMSECRDQLTMFLPRMAKGKTKEAQK